MSNTVISPEFFATVKEDVSAYIQKKLLGMEIEVTDLELHNSSLTKTFRAYLTLKRTTNLKALFLAEQIIIKEIENKFSFRPYAFYWRYQAEPGVAPTNKKGGKDEKEEKDN